VLTTTNLRRAEELQERFHQFASQYPDLSHAAIRSSDSKWPIHQLGRRSIPGLTVQFVASLLGTAERIPIPLMPHWLRIEGNLYQGFYLFWRWDWSLTELAEEGVQRFFILTDEAAGLFGSLLPQRAATTLPPEINEIDPWMSMVYETLHPVPRTERDFEILQIPGNVFAAVGGVMEQLSAGFKDRSPVQLHGSSMAGVKPTTPTRAYCLIGPNAVRWEGETSVQPRLWHLLGILLDCAGEQVPFDNVQEKLDRAKERCDKRLQNDVSALNIALEPIKWPVVYSTKGGFVISFIGRPE
jgi:hypothetical protein